MKNKSGSLRKRTQRDYKLAFKLAVVDQVEKGQLTYKHAQRHYGMQGRSTVLVWLRKHGTLDWSAKPKKPSMGKHANKETPGERIKRLERELKNEKDKNLTLTKMIDIVEQDYGVSIRKKYVPKPSGNSKRATK
jgi:transposase-like protein